MGTNILGTAHLRQESNKLAENLQYQQLPIVVAYGLMNAGKSFLLNMLTQHIEKEFFKTNDIRETAALKRFESDIYIYLDTPGLDASQQDDQQADLGASEADIVLFVHQPQGELEANEVGFLKNLTQSFGCFSASNIIVVLSKVDKETPEKIELIERKIKEQCEREIGFAPEILPVSTKRYQTGVLKQKNALIAASHILKLTEQINTAASNTIQVREQRLLTKIDVLLDKLNTQEKLVNSKQEKLRTKVKSGFSAFNEQVEQLQSFIGDSVSKYQNI